MADSARLDCISFTEYITNECWKKATAGSDPNTVMWITLSSCKETAKVIVVSNSERTELIFTKVNSTIIIKDNRLCYHKSNLIGKKKIN